jgi:periplasmic protein TonB
MGYQALLFCPDEKTARTVTQVLSELDFAVIPCTEPFATVKKLMSEHFDAVVVDCDNEQNATLLFKSARNTPNNQSSLAVAVVEGQAGVAKAFRIGANLVLTKPINVEQAKGTLRVARGLLRKGEGAKPATTAADTPVRPATPAPLQPGPRASAPTSIAPPPVATSVAATVSIPTQKPVPQPRVVAWVPAHSSEAGTEPATDGSKKEIAASQPTSSAVYGTSAASAPAPAREPNHSVSTEDKSSTVVAEPQAPVEKVAASDSSSSAGSVSSPAPNFTFGGTIGAGTEPASGRSKKLLVAVAAVLLIAVGGYAAWTHWGPSSGTTTVPSRVAAKPVTPATVPSVAPSSVPAATSPASSTATDSATSSSSDSAVAPQATGTATSKISSDSDTETGTSTENASTHPSKGSTGTTSSKPSASVPAASKASEAKPAESPIVIKNGAAQPTAKPPAVADEPAPSMTGIAPADSDGALPNLGAQSQAPAPVLQTLNVSQGVSRGLLVKQPQPVYPPAAMRMRIEGTVELSATISKDGNISAVKILSGDPQLAHAAVDAVKQWKYKPYLLNGEPVEIQTQVTINFKLPD